MLAWSARSPVLREPYRWHSERMPRAPQALTMKSIAVALSCASMPMEHEYDTEVIAQPQTHDTARALVARFCKEVPAMRVVPLPSELEVLWERCAPLPASSLSSAICDQLSCSVEEQAWQLSLRALHILLHFHHVHAHVDGKAVAVVRGVLVGTGWDFLQHLVHEVPQCREEALAVLALETSAPLTRSLLRPASPQQHRQPQPPQEELEPSPPSQSSPRKLLSQQSQPSAQPVLRSIFREEPRREDFAREASCLVALEGNTLPVELEGVGVPRVNTATAAPRSLMRPTASAWNRATKACLLDGLSVDEDDVAEGSRTTFPSNREMTFQALRLPL